jgi:hypothetical protein
MIFSNKNIENFNNNKDNLNLLSSKDILIQKIKENLLNAKFFNFIQPIIFYRYYRIFLENKIHSLKFKDMSTKISYFPSKNEILKSIKSRNGPNIGICSFFIANNLPFLISKLFDKFDFNINIPHLLTLYPGFIISYPFLLNANRAALNSKEYISLSLKKPQNILKIFFNKSNYKGCLLHLLNKTFYFIPLLNFIICYRLESLRFAYVFQKDSQGIDFKKIRTVYSLLKKNKTFSKGAAAYNFHLCGFYLTFFILFYQEYTK